MGMFFGLLSYVVVLAWVAPIFPFLYVIVKWRGGARGAGTHAAMLYFTTVALLLALAGAANLIYGAISVTPVDPEMTRISWGMLAGGLGFCVLNVVLLRWIGPLRDPTDVVRVFVGFVMVIAGMVAMGALIAMMSEIFREAESEMAKTARSDQIRMFGVWTLFYLATYLLTTRVLARNAVEGRS